MHVLLPEAYSSQLGKRQVLVCKTLQNVNYEDI